MTRLSPTGLASFDDDLQAALQEVEGSAPAPVPQETAADPSSFFRPPNAVPVTGDRVGDFASPDEYFRPQNATPVESDLPARKYSSQDIVQLMESDPARLQEVFARIKNRSNSDKAFAERVNELVGPIGRGISQGGQAAGDFVVGSIQRGLSYIPGLEGLSDLANHRSRLATIQAAYDQHLNETGEFASIVSAPVSQFTSDLASTVTNMLLTGGAGKAVGVKATRSMTAWYGAVFGLQRTEKSLQVATDAGLEGAGKNIYAGATGLLEGGLTIAFGRAAEKLGLDTAEEAISRGASRVLAKWMTKEGLTRSAVAMASEGLEEESIALSQAILADAMEVQDFDAYKQNFGKAFLTGAAARGVIGAGNQVVAKYGGLVEKMPDIVSGMNDAQKIRDGQLSVDDPSVVEKSKNDTYRETLEEELDELNQIERDVTESESVGPKRESDAGDARQDDASVESETPRREVTSDDIQRASVKKEKRDHDQEVQNVVAGKREVLQGILKAYGLDPIPETEQRSFLEMRQRAIDKGVPPRALELATESLSTGWRWDEDTHVGVIEGLRQNLDTHSEVKRRIQEVPQGSAELDNLLAQDLDFTRKVNSLVRAIAANTTTQGRALVSNRFAFSVADAPTALVRARRNKGSDLTPEETDAITKSAAEIQKLEKKMATTDPEKNPEKFKELRRKRFEAQMKLEDAQQAPVANGLVAAATGANFLWHTLFTGFDASFFGIHAALPLLLNPVTTTKAIFGAVPSIWTQTQETDAFLDLMTRPNADRYDSGDITLMKPNSRLNAREDLVARGFLSSWGKFDSLKGVVNFWPRSFRTIVNRVRADVYDGIVAANGGRAALGEVQLRDIGGFVDTITMRGGRGYLDKHANSMHLLLFAPRMYAAQVELLIGKPIWGASPESRKIIMRQYGRLITSFGVLAGASLIANQFANAAGEEDTSEIDLDPTSSKFMQVRFGSVWLDPTFRLARWLSFVSQAGKAGLGTIVDDADYGDEEGLKAGRFVLGKSSLPLSFGKTFFTGRDIFGRELSREETLQRYFSPISSQQMVESVEEFGVPKGVATGLVQTTGLPLSIDF